MDRFSYSRNGGKYHDINCLLHIRIPSVSHHGKKKKIKLYKIQVLNIKTQQKWFVYHRYTDFLKLRTQLLLILQSQNEKMCPGCVHFENILQISEFPKKHLFSSDSNVVLNYRKKALQSWLAMVLSHIFITGPKCSVCSTKIFTIARDFMTQELVPLQPPKDTSSLIESPGTSLCPEVLETSSRENTRASSRPETGEFNWEINTPELICEAIKIENFIVQHKIVNIAAVSDKGKFYTKEEMREQYIKTLELQELQAKRALRAKKQFLKNEDVHGLRNPVPISKQDTKEDSLVQK